MAIRQNNQSNKPIVNLSGYAFWDAQCW